MISELKLRIDIDIASDIEAFRLHHRHSSAKCKLLAY
jgi:hypothetical protein